MPTPGHEAFGKSLDMPRTRHVTSVDTLPGVGDHALASHIVREEALIIVLPITGNRRESVVR